ncbi:MAG: polyprenol monophosphomannose synthase [Bacteroidetes bacterium]|nr:MAG: polyprenol monophosphomannose synthase [Bacteroidota bacterium]
MNGKLVIIPTYNEKENIEAIIAAVFNLPEPFDVLIVDDNSPDKTSEIVSKLIGDQEASGKPFTQKLHLITRKGKLGLGTAYIEGFHFGLDNNYDYIFEMDADFSHNPDDLIRLHHACSIDGADMAIGSRYVTGVNVVNWPMGRVLMSYLASSYVRFITGMPFRDATAGFKCYKAQVLRTLDLDNIKFIGYAFQIEMKFDTWKHGFKIKEVPIIFTDRTKGQSKMSSGIFKEAVLGVMKLKISSWFKKYKQPAKP